MAKSKFEHETYDAWNGHEESTRDAMNALGAHGWEPYAATILSAHGAIGIRYHLKRQK